MPRLRAPAPATCLSQTELAAIPALFEPEPLRRHARGVGYFNGQPTQRDDLSNDKSVMALGKASPETAAGWARGLMHRIQEECARALEYWGQALTDGTVRPDSIPLGIALLLSKRMELQAEIATLTPSVTHTPADTLLMELTADLGPETLDSREMCDYPQLPAPHYPPA